MGTSPRLAAHLRHRPGHSVPSANTPSTKPWTEQGRRIWISRPVLSGSGSPILSQQPPHDHFDDGAFVVPRGIPPKRTCARLAGVQQTFSDLAYGPTPIRGPANLVPPPSSHASTTEAARQTLVAAPASGKKHQSGTSTTEHHVDFVLAGRRPFQNCRSNEGSRPNQAAAWS